MSDRFLFVGNRRFVLEEMIGAGVDLRAIVIIGGTHLERDYQSGVLSTTVPVHIVRSKQELLELLGRTGFDVLVSNGCPYILPVASLPPARYANIHPSWLPDLRGADPAIGAILHQRDCGATCHLMDAGIDTGPVISRVLIPYTDDLDVSTLYQLSFVAEKRAFSEALARGFAAQAPQEERPDLLYYSRSLADRTLGRQDANDLLLRKIKAFSNRSQGCLVSVNGNPFRVFAGRKMHNPFLAEVLMAAPPCTVALSYEGGVVFHKDGEVIRFDDIRSDDARPLQPGDQLFTP